MNGYIYASLLVIIGVALDQAIMHLLKGIETTQEVAKIRVQQADALADAQMAMAHTWLAATPVCPDCKTNDGRRRDKDDNVILYQEYTDVCYIYCHDPHLWHAAQCNFGTYSGKTQRYALLEIGKKLWAKQPRSYAGPIAAKVEGQ